MICLDNSEWMRNGDYAPNRFQAQCDAVNLVCGAKTQVFFSPNLILKKFRLFDLGFYVQVLILNGAGSYLFKDSALGRCF